MPGSRRWSVMLALVALGAAIVWLAPAERSLGAGIRWVYIHVALVWAGTLSPSPVRAGSRSSCRAARRPPAGCTRCGAPAFAPSRSASPSA